MARLPGGIIGAFVDRLPIDWQALLARAPTPYNRMLIEGLRFLDAVRASARPTAAPRAESTPSLRLLRFVMWMATAQTACSLVIVLIATAQGATPIQRTNQMVATGSFLAASLLLATAAPRDPRSIALLTWFVCASSAFARSIATGLPASWWPAAEVAFDAFRFEAFLPVCLWQFAQDFPRVQRFTAFDRIARAATTIAWLMAWLLFLVNLQLIYRVTESVLLPALLRSYPADVFWKAIAVAQAPAAAVIFIRARRASPPERQKLARLASAFVAGTAPFLLVGAAFTVSPQLNRKVETTDSAAIAWLDAIVMTALASGPILCSLAVIVDRPFELRAATGWLVRRALARGAVELLIVIPFAMLALTIYDLRHVAIRDILPNISPWLLAACSAATTFALFGRGRLWSALNRLESRRALEHHQELARMVERLRMTRGAREIAQVLQRELQDGTGATEVNILLPDRSGFSVPGDTSFTMDRTLAVLLRNASAAIDVSATGPWLDLLPPADREWIGAHDIAIIAAVKHRDDIIAAVLSLGPKRGGVPFDDRDRWLVTSIAAAAAAAWPTRDEADIGDTRSRAGLRGTRDEGEAAFECPSCGAVADALPLSCACGTAPQLASLPQRVGDHLLVTQRIGRGGMGIVYLARDEALGRDVALKTLPSLAPGAITRLQDEARAMAALDHPALATLFRVEMWQRTPILVVEYFPHGTLADRLARGPLAVDHAVRLGHELARALAYMHGHGVLHRDVKPSNIGMTPTGSAKLLDLGLASVLDQPYARERDATSGPTVPAGTRAYLPPEAIDGAAPAPALDLWALAVVMLECLTGINPFAHGRHASRNRQTLAADDEVVTAWLQIAPPALRLFLYRALSRDPARRFARAVEMLSALEATSAPLDMDADRISAQ